MRAVINTDTDTGLDITSKLQVLDYTTPASGGPSLYMARVVIDGVDGTGGDFSLYVNVTTVAVQPYPQVIEVAASEDPIIFYGEPFWAEDSEDVDIYVLSPNAADSSVAVTVELLDISPAQSLTRGRDLLVDSNGQTTGVYESSISSQTTVIASDTTVIDSRVQVTDSRIVAAGLGSTASRLTVIQSHTTLMEVARPTLVANSSSLVVDFAEVRAALGLPNITFQGGVLLGGFLSRFLTKVRLETDEPAVTAKYTNGILIEYAESAYARIIADLVRQCEFPPTVDYTITVDTVAAKDYPLPPHIKQVVSLDIVASNGDLLYKVESRDYQNIHGPGIRLEAGLLRVDRSELATADIVRIRYVPTGTARIHEGTLDGINSDGDEVTLAESPSLGALDTHLNAYAGMVWRNVSDTGNTPEQERLITSYDHSTRIATLAAPLDPIPSGTITYDVVPPMLYDKVLDEVVSVDAALRVTSNEGNRVRATMLNERLSKLMRDLRLTAAQWSAWSGGAGPHHDAYTRF